MTNAIYNEADFASLISVLELSQLNITCSPTDNLVGGLDRKLDLIYSELSSRENQPCGLQSSLTR